jgi:rod shape-determining protein MreC
MNRSSPRIWQTAVLVTIVVGVIVLAASGYLGSALKVAFNPLIGVQRWFTSRYLAIYEFVTIPKDAATLRQTNVQLENEVSQLQTQVIQLQQQLSETQVLYALLNFARAAPENQYVAAAIIGRDPSPFIHYVIIDHGSDDGLRRGMPVVTQQGLVGRISAVTAGAARVQLINDPGAVVNVKLKTSQTEVLLIGSVTGDVSLDMVPQSLQLSVGEVVLTSGLSGGYPANIVIGQVLSVRKRENDLFQTASVQPAVDFSRLGAVLIITNFKPVDITPLIQTPVP